MILPHTKIIDMMRFTAFPIFPRRISGLGLAAAVAAILPLAAACIPWVLGSAYTKDDLGAFHLPVRAFYAQQLERGEPFDWMPSLYGGMYLTGEGQAGGYHPVHWLFYRLLPFRHAAAMEWLVGYPWMFAGTWLLLRRRIGPLGAAYGAIAFTWCGFCLLHFIHPNAVAVAAHLPWLLWTIELAMTAQTPRQSGWASVGIALVFASQLLLGYPQYAYFSLWAAAGYLIFLWRERANRGKGVADGLMRVAIGLGLGTLLGAVQLLPTLDALRHSTRWAAAAGFSEAGALHPWNLVQLVAPYLLKTRVFGLNVHELGLYAGAAPLILAACALAEWKRLDRLRPLAWLAGSLAAFSLLWAFGPYAPLQRLLAWIPLSSSFRFPCRMIVVFQFAVAVLAALGFHLLCRRRGKSADARRIVRCAWALAAASLAVAVGGWMGRTSGYVAGAREALVGPALFAAAAALATLAASGRRWALSGLMLLTACDLGYYGLTYSVFPVGKPLSVFANTTPTPPGPPQGRVLAEPPAAQRGLRTGNAMLLRGWQRADGYAGLEPSRRLTLDNLAALRVANVSFVRRGQETAAIAGLQPAGDDWLRVPDPLPRAWLAAHLQASANPSADMPRIDPAATVLTEPSQNAAADWPEPRVPEAGEAWIRADRPGRIAIDCDAPERRMLVLAESWHEGWQAAVDGRPARALRVNGDFLGCPIDAGRHRVVFSFQPQSLRLGRFDSLLGLGLLPACLLAAARRPTAVNVSGA